MTNGGWTKDRDDETTLGFHFVEGDKKWIRDYSKEYRRYVQFNANQVVAIRVKK